MLVAVFLPGGLDLLDSLIPLNDYGRYADLHRNVLVDKPPLLRDSALGIHPSLAQGVGGGIKGLYDAGKLGFLPGIDYPNPNLSHFHSRHFWETGLIVDSGSPGWLGRWLDANGNADNPLQGMSLGYSLSPVMRSRTRAGRVGELAGQRRLLHPRDVRRGLRRGDEDVDRARAHARRRAGAEGRKARRIPRQAGRRPARALREDEDRRPACLVGRVPGAELVRQPPAHARRPDLQAARHPRRDRRRARPTSTRMPTSATRSPSRCPRSARRSAAFQADLEARGVADRVLTFVWSEFGRRPHDNDSGTDHGAGGLAWIQGTRARSGLLSEYPSLHDFDEDDNLKVTVDFRTVYASPDRAVARDGRRRRAAERGVVGAHPARAMTARRAIALGLAPLAGAAIALARSPPASARALAGARSHRLRSCARRPSAWACASTASPCIATASCPAACASTSRTSARTATTCACSGPAPRRAIRATSPEVKPDARYTLKVTLRRRGLYRLICTIGDHEARGMVARLRVVRKV